MSVSTIGMNRTKWLFEDSFVNVEGNVSSELKDNLKLRTRLANAGMENAMREEGMLSTDDATNMYLVDIKTDVKNGILNASTNGKRMKINTSIIPTTRYYEMLLDTIPDRYDDWTIRVKDIYGNVENAWYNVEETIQHEKWHDKLQLNKIKKRNGKVAKKTFADALEEDLQFYFKDLARGYGLNSKTKNHYMKSMEKLESRYMKDENLRSQFDDFGSFLAFMYFTPMVEGINQLTTENFENRKSNYQIHKNKKTNGLTTYDKFTEAAAYALDKMGYDNALQFYSDWVENPGLMKSYIHNFMNYRGQDLQENRNDNVIPLHPVAPIRNAA